MLSNPFYDSIQNTHRKLPPLGRPGAAGKERRDIGHDKAKSVDNGPGDYDPLQPRPRFIHGTTGFGEIHEQQSDGYSDDRSDSGDGDHLTVQILHDFACLLPNGGRCCKDLRSEAGEQGHDHKGSVKMLTDSNVPLLLVSDVHLCFQNNTSCKENAVP